MLNEVGGRARDGALWVRIKGSHFRADADLVSSPPPQSAYQLSIPAYPLRKSGLLDLIYRDNQSGLISDP